MNEIYKLVYDKPCNGMGSPDVYHCLNEATQRAFQAFHICPQVNNIEIRPTTGAEGPHNGDAIGSFHLIRDYSKKPLGVYRGSGHVKTEYYGFYREKGTNNVMFLIEYLHEAPLQWIRYRDTDVIWAPTVAELEKITVGRKLCRCGVCLCCVAARRDGFLARALL